jgi:DNA-binding transcriptional MerR regulator
MNKNEYYYIGHVSKATGVSCKTIRFYEELGLISKTERANKYRVYRDSHIEQILLIRQAKDLGFTLAELKGLLNHYEVCDDFPWERVLEMIKGKVEENNEAMESIKKQNQRLGDFFKKIEKKCEEPIDSAP